jgi:tRNA modification GTPase
MQSYPDEYLLVSAKDGSGVQNLKNHLYDHAIGNARPGEEVIISNVRHYRALEKAGASLTEAAEGIEAGMTQELVALDIRHAVHYLGEITGGAISTDEVLGNIFGKFCIGK